MQFMGIGMCLCQEDLNRFDRKGKKCRSTIFVINCQCAPLNFKSDIPYLNIHDRINLIQREMHICACRAKAIYQPN